MSTKRITRHVETLRGAGQLVEGQTSLGVYPYVIDVSREFLIPGPTFGPQGPPEELPGHFIMSGRLTQAEGLDLFKLQGQPLVLTLADGREVDVWLDGPRLQFMGGPREPGAPKG